MLLLRTPFDINHFLLFFDTMFSSTTSKINCAKSFSQTSVQIYRQGKGRVDTNFDSIVLIFVINGF